MWVFLHNENTSKLNLSYSDWPKEIKSYSYSKLFVDNSGISSVESGNVKGK